MEKAVITEKLTYAYPPDEGKPAKTVFEDINLEIEKGSFTAVLGRNGSGKSTFAKQLNGILLPVGGSVRVFGMDTSDESLLLEIRRTVGMVFQNPDNQIVSNVVEEDVAFAPENLGVPSEEIRRRVDDALKTVGMYEYRDSAPHMLSGGQKQRIAIAGVIAMQPKCIVLDEPTAMLDPQGREDVLRTIRELNRDAGVTVILITHHMTEAAMADRVIVMGNGRICLDGAPAEVFSHVEEMHDLGLAVPDTVELLWRLNRSGAALPLTVSGKDACAAVIAGWLSGNGKEAVV